MPEICCTVPSVWQKSFPGPLPRRRPQTSLEDRPQISCFFNSLVESKNFIKYGLIRAVEDGRLVARPRDYDGDSVLVVLRPGAAGQRRRDSTEHRLQTPDQRDGARRLGRAPSHRARRQLHLRHLLLLRANDPHQPSHCRHVSVLPQRHLQLRHRVEVRTSSGSTVRPRMEN